jgi:A/G-specific adenine glycosylase
MEPPEFVQIITTWYRLNKRILPWRSTKSPYFIWLSEVLLQQTRVNQGLPYYYKFVNEFDNITSLAQADESKILRMWQGLGYYSRARNMHTTAKLIVEKHNTEFPNNFNELIKLKGVGEYTAAAIASFAFEEKVAVVDGNVYRVLSRYYGIDTDILSSQGKKEFKALANSLMPENNSSTYNQAIMEFGALQCTPGMPDCQNCPLNMSCYARANHIQRILPVKTKNKSKKQRYFQFLVYTYKEYLLMKKQEDNDIWKGMYQFPLLEGVENTLQEPREGYNVSPKVKHILSHQIIEAVFLRFNLPDRETLKQYAMSTNSKIVSIDECEQLPKSVLINNYLKENIF